MDEIKGVALSRVIGGVVQSLMEARYLGDREAAKWRELYSGENMLGAYATTPAYVITEAEIEIRFAVVGEAEKGLDVMELPVSLHSEYLQTLRPEQIQVLRLKLAPGLPPAQG